MDDDLRAKLRRDITAIAAVIDSIYDNTPGTAERAVYWCWTPEGCGIQVLRNLRADAMQLLREALDKEHRAAA